MAEIDFEVGVDKGKFKRDMKEMTDSFEELPRSFENAFKSGRMLDAPKSQLKKLIRETESDLVTLRSKYKDLVDQMKESGLSSSEIQENPVIKKLTEDIGMADAELKGLKQNLRDFQQTKGLGLSQVVSGAQGLMGAFTAAQGALSLFNASSKDLVRIQTKLQASMSILMGFQSAYNAYLNTGELRTKLAEKATLLLAKAQQRLATASVASKVAMGGLVAVLAAAATALAVFVSKHKTFNDNSAKIMNAATDSFASQYVELLKLQAQWDATNGSVKEQQKLLKSDSWDKLGISVKNISDAENVLVKNTEAVVNSMIAKAKAAAIYADAQDSIEKAARKQMKADKLEKDKENGRFSVGAWIAAALTTAPGGDMRAAAEAQQQARIDRNNKAADKARDKAMEELSAGAEYDKEAENILKEAGIVTAERRKLYEEWLKNEIQYAKEYGTRAQQRAALVMEWEHKIAELPAKYQNEARRKMGIALDDFDKEWEAKYGTYAQKRAEKVRQFENSIAQVEDEALRDRAKKQNNYQLAQEDYSQAQKYGSQGEIRASLEKMLDAEIETLDDKQKELAKAKKDFTLAEFDYNYIKEWGDRSSIREALVKQLNKEIAQLEAAGENAKAEAMEKIKGQKLYEFDSKYDKDMQLIFSDPAKLAKNDLVKALDLATKKFREMDQAANPEAYKAMREQIHALSEELDGYGLQAWGKYSSAISANNSLTRARKERDDAEVDMIATKGLYELGAASIDDITRAEKDFEQAQNNVNRAEENFKNELISLGEEALFALPQILSNVSAAMSSLAEATDNVKLGEKAEELGAFAQNLSSAAEGFKSGGWIGAIVGGVADMFSQTFNLIVNMKEGEKSAKEFERALRLAALDVSTIDSSSIFGSNEYGHAKSAWEIGQKAIEEYRNSLSELERQTSELASKGGKFGWGEVIFGGFTPEALTIALLTATKGSNKYAQQLDAIQKGYKGIEAMSIKTKNVGGWGRFWGAQDQYTSLKDLAPQLWDANGELQTEALRTFLETNTQLDAVQRKELENILKIKESYDAAMDSVRSYASDILGDFSVSIGDAVCDSILRGEDAMEQLGDVGAKMIDNFARSAASSWVLENYLNQFEDEMVTAFGTGSSTGVTDVVSKIVSGLPAAVQGVTEMVQGIYDYAEQSGIDLSSLRDDAREATTKGLAGITQDQGDELNGRFTAIQGYTFEINATTQTIREQNEALMGHCAAMLLHIQGIHGDTSRISDSLDSMRGEIRDIRNSVGTMLDQGVTMN